MSGHLAETLEIFSVSPSTFSVIYSQKYALYLGKF